MFWNPFKSWSSHPIVGLGGSMAAGHPVPEAAHVVANAPSALAASYGNTLANVQSVAVASAPHVQNWADVTTPGASVQGPNIFYHPADPSGPSHPADVHYAQGGGAIPVFGASPAHTNPLTNATGH